jgi:hypothetical protein
MKTPWRFVSDLVSRKPADKPQDAPPRAVVDAKLIDLVAVHEGKPEQTTSIEPTPVDLPANRVVHDEIEAAPVISEEPISEAPKPEPAAADATTPAAEIDATDVKQEPVAATPAPEADASIHDVETAPVIATMTAPEPEAQKVPKRARVSNPLAPRIPVEAPAVPPKSLLEEMSDLDLEIGSLRRQLSAKLATQNAQMRELLDRYEAR